MPVFEPAPPPPPPALPGFLDALAPVLNNWGYLAVGALVMLEDFGIPVPGETVLIAAAVYAGAGVLNIWVVIAVGIVAAVVGDSIGYVIGRYGGRRLVLRYGKYVFITPERLDKAEAFFQRHGGKIVTIARFIEGLRQANGIIAGITQMRWIRFFAFNLLGAVLWVCTWAGLGYLAGANITHIWDTIERYQPIVYTVLALLVLAFLTWQIIRHRKAKRAKVEAAASGAAAPPSDGAPDLSTGEAQPSGGPAELLGATGVVSADRPAPAPSGAAAASTVPASQPGPRGELSPSPHEAT